MAQDAAQDTILAIAFIVESSLPVYQQWSIILRDYLTHILKRLADAFSGSRMRVAFITYGPADMQQSPLLCKRFFVDHQVVFKEMKDSPGKLGFGQANTGGDRGMAALEAHIAALELFDILNEPSHTKRGRVLANFVFHVAACPPDSSQYPQWNDLTSLDCTTWDTLPQEYQKRNLIYNAIILNNQLRQFVSLHSSQLRGQSKPWFPVQASHVVLLSGIPISEPKTTPAKRTGDLDRIPESKRPRLGLNKPETPSQGNGSVPTPQGQNELSPQHISTPTGPSQHVSTAQFLATVRALDDNIRGLEAKISEARLANNAQLADKLSLDCRRQKDVLNSLQRRVLEHMQSLKSGGGSGNTNSATTSPVAPPQADTPSTLLSNNQKRMGTDLPPSYPQTLDIGDSSDSLRDAIPETSFKPHGQAPLDQERMTLMPSRIIQPNSSPFSGHLPPQPSSDTARGQFNVNTPVVWQGQLIWNGLGSMGKKECRATVVALSQSATECRTDTWPPQLTLMPTLDPAVSPAELREWIARFKPVICRFQPKSEAGDLTNEQYYKSLIQLLITKRVFAVAGWTLPSGAQRNNVLIFPTNGQVLLGAFFPLTGIPEIPKARPASIHSAASRHGPEFLAQLQRLPPEKRNFVIARLLQRSNPHPSGGTQAQSGLMAAQLQTLQAQNVVQAIPHSSPENSGFGSPELVPSNNTADSISSRVLQQLSHIGSHDGAPLHRAQNDFQSGHQT